MKKEKDEKVKKVKSEKSVRENKKADAKATKKVEAKEQPAKKVEEKESASLGKYVVVFDKEDKLWKIKRDNAKRVIASYETKADALARVKILCENNDAGVVVKKKNGQFQKKKNIRI